MQQMNRRRLLQGGGALLGLAAAQGCTVAPRREPHEVLKFAPVRASMDRVTRITVCTRPFRAAGPRLDVERLGDKTIVHNYGHGGSGWSLSWGSSSIAAGKALVTGEHEVAVLGCGALGLTSALTLQRRGARVTIYAKELPPNVRSSLATGLWTPDSRICLEENATAEFRKSWADMARTSWNAYQGYFGLAGSPVEFIDSYFVSDSQGAPRRQTGPDSRPAFAELQHELLADLMPAGRDLKPGQHALGNRFLRQNSQLMFNVTNYSKVLLSEFYAAGGKIEVTDFSSRNDLVRVREKTLINSTGYGARSLFDDASVVPVRGQLARLISQPEVNYGLFYNDILFVPRRDGLVLQAVGENDYFGYDDPTVIPDRSEAERAVNTIAALFAQG